MRILCRHFIEGLLYKSFFRLIPAFVGTLGSLTFVTAVIYGMVPMVLLIITCLGLSTALLTTIIYFTSFFSIKFMTACYCALVILVFALLCWLIKILIVNHQAKLKFARLCYSSRAALLIIGKLLCNRHVDFDITANTRFYELHIFPAYVGKINHRRDKDELIKAIVHDYKRITGLLGNDVVLFGCSPGSFARLLRQAGLNDAQFIVIKTIIPKANAQVLGLRRHFYLHIIKPDGILSPENRE